MITQNERNELAQIILNTAVFYGKYDLTKEQITIYISVLDDKFKKTFIDYKNSIQSYCADSKNKFFPAPANLSAYLNPEINDDAQAVSIAAKVIEAVSKFGWCNSQSAKNYIGDIGWAAVTAFGGWQHVCENLGLKIQLSTFNAQVRDIIKAEVQKSKFKIITTGPQITHQEKTNLDFSNLASGLVKDLKLVGNK